MCRQSKLSPFSSLHHSRPSLLLKFSSVGDKIPCKNLLIFFTKILQSLSGSKVGNHNSPKNVRKEKEMKMEPPGAGSSIECSRCPAGAGLLSEVLSPFFLFCFFFRLPVCSFTNIFLPVQPQRGRSIWELRAGMATSFQPSFRKITESWLLDCLTEHMLVCT